MQEHIIYFLNVKFKKNTKKYKNTELESENTELENEPEQFTSENQINIKYTTVNGLIENDYLIYNRNGNLISKLHYKSDKLDGESIHYNILVRNSDEMIKIKKYICTYSNGIQLSTKEYD